MKDVKRAAETFDKIADHFDKTRNRPWEEVVKFLKIRKGRTLDLGCGNGRHIIVGNEIGHEMVGIDASMNLIKIAKRKTNSDTDFIRANAKRLPFKNNTFDNVIYIATIHHLKKGRVQSLKEVKRILKQGGEILVSAWARESDRWDLEEGENDVIVPWNREDGKVIDRFYHLYTLEELIEDIEKSKLEVIKSFHSKGNNYVIASK